MKKNDWILTITAALYSFLFYGQTPGINFLIFNLVLIICLVIKENELVKNTRWTITATGSLLSSLCIAYYGNGLSVTANIISLGLLSAMSYNRNTSVIFALLFSFYSACSALVYMFLNWQDKAKKTGSSQPTSKRVLLITLPIFITFLFFVMYQQSNVLFKDFSKNINLDFISWSWISFTIGGIILLYGFFYHRNIGWLASVDENAPDHINALNKNTITLFGKKLSISDEEFSGILLFALLNFLLIVVNVLDINFIFINRKLPEGITYSEFVHQGTGTLIISILMAIAIILFYFRGALNFSEKSKYIKLLAYLWIAQNSMMLISTAFRNELYVTEYGFTYKRIGVYIYLLLTLIGLATAFIKVLNAKSNHYLFRVNGWLFYGALIISCFINWDRQIAEFNIYHSKKPDKEYLLKLSDTNLPLLILIEQNERNWDRKLYYFLKGHKNLGWKSWHYDNTRIYNDLVRLNEEQKILRLDLSALGLQALEPLRTINNVKELDLHVNEIRSIKEVLGFKTLKELDLRDNKISSMEGIASLSELEYLTINQNPIHDYTPLFGLKKLKRLRVDRNIEESQYQLLKNNLPEAIITKI